MYLDEAFAELAHQCIFAVRPEVLSVHAFLQLQQQHPDSTQDRPAQLLCARASVCSQ